MKDHPNATRIRQLFAAFRAHDLNSVREALADDAVWHFPGRSGGLAGSHRGHDAIFEFLGRVVSLTDGNFRIELEHVVADDEVVVAMFRGCGERAGRELNNPTCLKIRMAKGRAAEIWEFVWDLYAVDEFWS